MFAAYRAWRRRRFLLKHPLNAGLWQQVSLRFVFFERLTESEKQRLAGLCALFLHEKQISAAGNFQLSDEMKLGIAIQACILILNLGLDFYRDWVEVIVYPEEFFPRNEYRNEQGLVQTDDQAYAGQAWLHGPVILSWASVERAWRQERANVVIHEFSHKLDMLNGDANGFPPLHAGMSRQHWAQAFTQAYEDLRRRVQLHQMTALDAYGCESPAEFFAVASEAFFNIPAVLARCYPSVYDQLVMFYRQDPAGRAPDHDRNPAQ